MWSSESGEGKRFAIVSRRNNSSSLHVRQIAFGSLAFFTLAVAGGFALFGAWPVLPFAGLECVALYVAYKYVQRHEEDYETITIDEDDVIVETKSGGELDRHQISRYWAQVVIESGPGRGRRVFLRSHGKDVEFGRLLSDEAKVFAAKRLRAHLTALG